MRDLNRIAPQKHRTDAAEHGVHRPGVLRRSMKGAPRTGVSPERDRQRLPGTNLVEVELAEPSEWTPVRTAGS